MALFDPTTGSLMLPIWVAATVAAALVALAILSVARAGAIRTVATLVGLGVVGYAVWAGSLVIDRVGLPDRSTDLRAYEQRVATLMAQSLQPGSALGCL